MVDENNALEIREETRLELPQSSSITYTFDLILQHPIRARGNCRGEMRGVARISRLEIEGQNFVLGEQGYYNGREYLIAEAKEVAVGILRNYKPNMLTISGGIYDAIKSGLSVSFETDGERNIKFEDAMRNAMQKHPNIKFDPPEITSDPKTIDINL